MSKNILIISSYFPPIPGVGGRRWAKFTKFLSRKEELNIHVISAENTVKGLKSSYEDELKGLPFKHSIFPTNYPSSLEYLEYSKRSLVNSVKVRLNHALIKKRVPGNYWDNTAFWEGYFKKEIPQIIASENIEKVIISGPPYRYIKYAVEMKQRLKNFELVLDYRDPWNDFNEPLPMSEKRKQYEIDLELHCLRNVDKILVVSDFQKELLLKKADDFAPIYVLRNGFDTEDILKGLKPKAESGRIKIAHFGTLHIKKEYYWRPFLQALEQVRNEDPHLYNTLDVEFIGFCPPAIEQFIKEKELNVKLFGVLEPGEAYNELNQADVVLWFKYDLSPGDFATKFGDYIALKKYMWCFSVKGVVTEHIKENQIGKIFYRSSEQLQSEIVEALKNVEDPSQRTFNPEYDAEELTIKSLTDRLLEILED